MDERSMEDHMFQVLSLIRDGKDLIQTPNERQAVAHYAFMREPRRSFSWHFWSQETTYSWNHFVGA
jgi:hypothetical protein